MSDPAAVRAALQKGGVSDITTRGRRSGRLRRIEIVFHAIDGRIYITGMPGRRDWLANLAADPRLIFHLKRGPVADLPATARIVTDPVERRPVMESVTRLWGRPSQVEAFMASSPLIEVRFDDPSVLAADSPAV